MKKQNFKIALHAAFLSLVLVSCSKDDLVNDNKNNSESGILSNDEVTLIYGNKLLDQYVNYSGSQIDFDRIGGMSARSTNSIPSYPYANPSQIPNNAITIPGGDAQTYNNAGIYHLPVNSSISKITVNGGNNVILIIDGKITSELITNGNAKVYVGPSGEIKGNITMNGGNSELHNWGVIENSNGAIQGNIINNNVLDFTASGDINLNGNSDLTNNCKMRFTGKVNMNKAVVNNSFIDFKNGFYINGSGKLNLASGSYTKVSGGTYGYDGIIENEDANFARIDFDGTKGNINGTQRIKGLIDINSSFVPNVSSNDPVAIKQAFVNYFRTDSNVVFNQDLSITGSACTEAAGQTNTLCDGNLTFTLISNFKYERDNGTYLSATDVKVKDNFAYVSYHSNDAVDNNGNTPNGSIRVFDLTNAGAPILSAQAEFNKVEFNGIDVDNDVLYAVGNNRDGARLLTTPLVSKSFDYTNLDVFATYKLSSSSAKNTYIYANKLWYTSGKTNGGLFTLDLNNNYTENSISSKNGAKYVAKNATKQAFFAVEGSQVYLRIANIDGTGAVEYNYTALTQEIQDGKNVIAMDDDYVYVALSDRGVAKINLTNGAMVSHFEPNEYRPNGSKVFRKNGATNGVAVDGCYVYLANGADGVIVLNKETFSPIGSFTISNGSANFVSVSNGYLFVATGRGGLNYIKIN